MARSAKKKTARKAAPTKKKKENKALKSLKGAKPRKVSPTGRAKAAAPSQKTFKTASRPAGKPGRIPPSFLPLQKKLQNRRHEILSQVDHLEHDLRDEMADSQNTPGDLADHGAGELSQHLSVTLMENDRLELERIEEALRRLEEGTYGVCDVCGKPIPLSRLRALPWANRCIACQSRFENG